MVDGGWPEGARKRPFFFGARIGPTLTLPRFAEEGTKTAEKE